MNINRLPLDLGQSNAQSLRLQRTARGEEQEEEQAGCSSGGATADADVVQQLLAMGGGQWSLDLCTRAAVVAGNDSGLAVDWCFSHAASVEAESETKPTATETEPLLHGATVSIDISESPSGAELLRAFSEMPRSDGMLDISVACGGRVTQATIDSLRSSLDSHSSWKSTGLRSLRLRSTGQPPVKLAFSTTREDQSRYYVLDCEGDVDLSGQCLGSADAGLVAVWLRWRDAPICSLTLRNNLLIGNGKVQTQQEFDEHGDFTPPDYVGFATLCSSLSELGRGGVEQQVHAPPVRVDLSRCKLDAKATEILARNLSGQISDLNLSGNPISNAMWDGVAWRACPEVAHEFVTACNFLKRIKRLDVSGCQLRGADMMQVASLCCAVDSSLVWVSILGNPACADFPIEQLERAFTGTPRLRTLLGIDEGVEELDLTNTAAANEVGVVNLLGLGDIFEQTVGLPHMPLLAMELRLCRSARICRLVLDGNILSSSRDDGMRGDGQRSHLDVKKQSISEVDNLMDAIASSSIGVLRLRSCGLGAKDFAGPLRQLLAVSTSLTHLDISRNLVGHSFQRDQNGWCQFCEALSQSAVMSFHIESCSIGADYARVLAQHVLTSNLTSMSILGNPIGTSGAQALIDSFNATPQILTLLGIKAGTVELDVSAKGLLDPGQSEVLAVELASRRNAADIQCLTTTSTGSGLLKPVDIGSGVVMVFPKADVDRSGPRKFVLNCTDVDLDLSEHNLGVADIHVLCSWLGRSSVALRRLNLCGNPLEGGEADLVKVLQANEGLQTVCGFQDHASAIEWCDSQKTATDIRLLSIELAHGRALATSGLSVDLSSNPAIVGTVDTRFRLKSPDLHTAELSTLLRALASRAIELNLSGCGLGPEAAGVVAEFISEDTTLQTIHMSNNLLFGWTLKGEEGTAPVASEQKIDLPSDGFSMNLFDTTPSTSKREGTAPIASEQKIDLPSDGPTISSFGSFQDHEDRCVSRPVSDSDSDSELARVMDHEPLLEEVNCLIEELQPTDAPAAKVDKKHVAVDTVFQDFVHSSSDSSGFDSDEHSDQVSESSDTEAEDKHFALINHRTSGIHRGWNALCSAICTSNTLKDVRASNVGMGPDGCQVLAKAITSLCLIDISVNAVFGIKVADTFFGTEMENAVDAEQAGWIALCDALVSSELATLIATDIGMGPEGCQKLSEAVSISPSLQSIAVDSTGDLRHRMTFDSKRGQHAYILDTTTTDIRLRAKNLGPADVKLLEAWLAKPQVSDTVELIDILSNPIGESVDGLIDFYKRHHNIRTLLGIGPDERINLDLSGKNIDPGQAKMLSAELNTARVLTSVESIDLSNNDLGANGIDSLMAALLESKISTITSIKHDSTVQADAARFLTCWTTLNRRLVGPLPDELTAMVDNDLAAFAARYSHPIMMEFLVSSDGASVSAFVHYLTGQGPCKPDADGATTLAHIAASNCHLGLLKALVGLGADPDARDEQGRSVMQLAEVSESEETRLWARTLTAFLGRYRLDHGANIHRSRTAKTHYATDQLLDDNLVVLKWMQNRSEFESEISARHVNGRRLSSTAVISVVGWHTPEDQPFSDPSGQTQEAQSTTASDEYPYVLVLKQGERSLHDVCAKERLAGYDVPIIVETVKAVAQCVAELHDVGICHGDLKQRNILRLKGQESTSWILCDMDASAIVGTAIGKKTSSAYAPPELAKCKFANGGIVIAAASFDIWSLGVIIFELCCGRTLFAQDINNDELVEIKDRTRLCTWLCIADNELDTVFSDAHVAPAIVQHAKNLIRWCLMANPEERPTITQVLAHEFFTSDLETKQPVTAIPMRYHAFMSHAQADASGTVGTLYFSYQQLGLYNWIDMRQEQLTLEGMRQGVRDSSVFLLVLSERVLASWFCQQEMLTAIEEGKPIQLVLEQEARFHPFDLESWTAQTVAGASIRTIVIQGRQVEVPSRIATMIDRHLPQAVTYRRRDFENDAMMRELCHRNGIVLPRLAPDLLWAKNKAAVKVFVIYNDRTAASMLQELQDATADLRDRVVFTTDTDSQVDANRVLVLLTAGVMQPPSLQMLAHAIALDKEHSQDRIVAVYSGLAGWRFGCAEHTSAPPAVQACLDEHEAIAYRPCDPSGPNRHEFPAMVQQLLSKLGVGDGVHSNSLQREPSSTIVPVKGVRDRLASCERVLASNLVELEEARALIERQAMELQELRSSTAGA